MVSYIKLTAILSLSFLILTSCIIHTDGIAPGAGDPFDGYRCDVMVDDDQTSDEFVALLQNGASSSDPFRICIAEGVLINSPGNVNSISINASNIEIRGANTKTATIYTVSTCTNNSSNLVRFTNLKILDGGGMSGPLYAGGSASVEVVGSIVTTSNSMGSAVTFGNNSIGLVQNSVVTSSGSDAIMAIAQNGASTRLTVKGSIVISNSAGVKLVSQNSSTLIATVNGNTYKANGSGGGMGTTAGISSVAQNTSLVTLNDSSTSPKNLFCNVSGSSVTMSAAYEQISQNSSTINGTFNIANTQNGTNTNISICP